MKTKLILGSFLAFASAGYSQWAGPGASTTTANIYRTGNVGLGNVGTTSPAFAIDIVTDIHENGIRIQQTGTGQCGVHLNSGATGGHKWSILSNGSANSNGGLGNFSINDNTPGFLTPRFVIQGSNGNIGIGTISPAAKLDVIGNFRAQSSLAKPLVINDGTIDTYLFQQGSNVNGMWVLNNQRSYGFGEDANGIGHIWSDVNGLYSIINFKRDASYINPQVWIGGTPKTPHTDFMFAVAGKIVAQSLYVTASGNTNWADYVFADTYKLPNLYDVEKYYKANKHLPEIPTAKEVEEKGIDVGEMNALLLKKIEELTIHMVEQQKQIDELKSKLK